MRVNLSVSAELDENDYPAFGYVSHFRVEKDTQIETTIARIEQLAAYGYEWSLKCSDEERGAFKDLVYFFQHLDVDPAAAAQALRNGKSWLGRDADSDGFVGFSNVDMDSAMSAAVGQRSEEAEALASSDHATTADRVTAQLKQLSAEIRKCKKALKDNPRANILRSQSLRAKLLSLTTHRDSLKAQKMHCTSNSAPSDTVHKVRHSLLSLLNSWVMGEIKPESQSISMRRGLAADAFKLVGSKFCTRARRLFRALAITPKQNATVASGGLIFLEPSPHGWTSDPKLAQWTFEKKLSSPAVSVLKPVKPNYTTLDLNLLRDTMSAEEKEEFNHLAYSDVFEVLVHDGYHYGTAMGPEIVSRK